MKSEEIKYKGHTIEIHTDEDPINPRENDNLGTMICFHRSYDLGDPMVKDDYTDQDSFKAYLKANEKQLIILPLYLYDHSGITMNTTGFSCPWDSGQVGIIYITKEKARKEYGWKSLNAARIEKIKERLRAEVKEYDQYLTGDVYGYVVKDSTGEEIHSCWGYWGSDHEASDLLPSARGEIDATIEAQRKAHQAKLKALIQKENAHQTIWEKVSTCPNAVKE